MLCPKCDRANTDGAKFCDSCGAQLAPDETGITPAAIGPTARLEEARPLDEPPMHRQRLVRSRQINGGLWLIGIAILFLTHTFWPGILVLAALSGYLEEQARGRPQEGMRTLIFLCGLALLFQLGWFWPGVLILIGLTALLSPEVRPAHA
jgi:hypothetical protein